MAQGNSAQIPKPATTKPASQGLRRAAEGGRGPRGDTAGEADLGSVVCIHTHTHLYVYIGIVSIYVCMYVCMYVRMYVCMYVCMYV